MSLDFSIQERLRQAQADNNRLVAESGIETEGRAAEHQQMDDVSARVTRVEARIDAIDERLTIMSGRLDRVETRLDGIDTRLRGVEQTLAEINGKLTILTATTGQLVGKLPSWWQMPAVIGITVVLLTGLWAAAQYLVRAAG